MNKILNSFILHVDDILNKCAFNDDTVSIIRNYLDDVRNVISHINKIEKLITGQITEKEFIHGSNR